MHARTRINIFMHELLKPARGQGEMRVVSPATRTETSSNAFFHHLCCLQPSALHEFLIGKGETSSSRPQIQLRLANALIHFSKAFAGWDGQTAAKTENPSICDTGSCSDFFS